MADDDGGAAAADNDGGLAGDKKDTPAQKKQVKNEHILVAVGLLTLIVTIIYMRRQAAANQTATVTNGAPQTTSGTPYGGGGNSSQANYTNGELATLASDMQEIQSEIVGLQATQTGGTGSSGAGATSGATTPTSPTTLPPYNAAAWQQLYQFGQYTSDEFTQIGTETAAGQYSGEQVGGGVPVFASNGFGGLQQGVSPFAPGTKAGTTFYIPSNATAYEHQ